MRSMARRVDYRDVIHKKKVPRQRATNLMGSNLHERSEPEGRGAWTRRINQMLKIREEESENRKTEILTSPKKRAPQDDSEESSG